LEVLASPAPTTTLIDPGDDFAKALDIGNVGSNVKQFTDFVGATDNVDYYRFNLTQTSDFRVSLMGLADLAYVEIIYDGNNNGLYDSDEELYYKSGYKGIDASITSALGAGSYLLKVYTNSIRDNTNYTLGVSATAIQTLPTDPGNSISTALDISNLSGTRTFKDFVGSTDRNDWYRFNLPNRGKFSLSLTGLSDYGYVELISYTNGGKLGEASGHTSRSASIINTLSAGSYLIRVYTNGLSDNTAYTLTLLA
jgi:hypothetical protein